MILHILKNKEWLNAIEKGEYTPGSIQSEGFIHCATIEQVVQIANLFFTGESNLKVLCIDATKVKAEIVFEDTENFGQVFPHIYGTLNLDSIVKVVDFNPGLDGKYSLPLELKDLKI